MSVSSSGAVTLTNTMSGGVATSASLSANSNLLQGTGSVGFSTTASLLAVSSSQQQISASLLTLTASYTALSSSYIALSASYNTFSGSASTRVTQIENTYATTGSNSFRANQSITGSLVVSSTITAQTLVVQTVTSSIVYSSGSNLFGSALSNTQTFTGSLNVTGSTHSIFGNVGIGLTNPSQKLEVASGSIKISNNGSGLILPGSIHTSAQINFYNANTAIELMKLPVANNTFTFYANTDKLYYNSDKGSVGNFFALTTDGNVGIGTTNPSRKLHILSTDDTRGILIHNSSTTSYAELHLSGSREYRMGTGGSGADASTVNNFYIYDAAASSHRLTINSSGYVGIGTTVPTELLHVKGNIRAGNIDNATNFAGTSPYIGIGGSTPLFLVHSSGYGLGYFGYDTGGDRLIIATDNGGGNNKIDFSVNAGTSTDGSTNNVSGISTAMRITGGGNVLIGNTTNYWQSPFTALDISSTFTAACLGSSYAGIYENIYYDGSTYRFKVAGYGTSIVLSTSTGAHSFATWGTGAASGVATGVERMGIDASGRVTMPYQPAFKAGLNTSTSVGANSTIIFNDTSGNHFNIGGHYSTSTGLFTAPVAGRYIFSTIIIYQSMAAGQAMDDAFYIYKNSSLVAYSFRRAEYEAGYTGNAGYYVDHANILLNLAASDTVSIRNNRALDVHGNTNYTYFYGYLLG